MDMFDAEKIVNAGITELEIRSVMTCRAHVASAPTATVPICPTVNASRSVSLLVSLPQSPSVSPVPS